MSNDRWATTDELKSALKGTKVSELRRPDFKHADTGGPVLAYRGRRVWSYSGEGHSLYLGSTGTGKSRRGILPLLNMILYSGESAVVVDPKMELYGKTYWLAKKLGYKIHLINFADIVKSEGYNIMAEIAKLYKSGDRNKQQIALDMLIELAIAFFPDNKDDPFWINSARSLFIAVVTALLEYADLEEINLASVYQFIASGDGRQQLGKTCLQMFVDSLPAESAVAQQMYSYATTANDTRAGIRSTCLEGLSLFSRNNEMIKFFSGNGLDVSVLTGDTKTIIFICIPDRTPIYDKVCGVIVSQLLSRYIQKADEDYNSKPPIPLHFIIDEFGNVSQSLGNMPHYLSAGRSRGIHVHYVLQSLSQLTAAYSPSDAKTILNNTDIIISFRTNDWETMDSLSKMAGERTIDYGNYQAKEPLMSPAKFQELDTGQAFVSLRGKYRFVTFLPDYEEIFDCSEWEEPIYPVRHADGRVPLFDIKKYVENTQKKSNIASSEPLLPFRIPRPQQELDEYVKHLDEIILEFEEEENKQEAKKKKGTERKSIKTAGNNAAYKYEVTILRIGEGKQQIARTLSDMCKISFTFAMEKLSSLPASFKFRTKREALDAEAAVCHVGGVAMIDEVE